VLLSSSSRDTLFAIPVQAIAATTTLRVAMHVPVRCSDASATLVAGRNGAMLGWCGADGIADLVIVDLDRRDPTLARALTMAPQWCRLARGGDICRAAHVDDARNRDREDG
jgi:hypothetical protein